jgi:hypothetical protein
LVKRTFENDTTTPFLFYTSTHPPPRINEVFIFPQ